MTTSVIYNKNFLASFIDVDFEGKKYKAPANYDEYLRQMYGDYMKLPPKKYQVTHHHFEAFMKEDSDE